MEQSFKESIPGLKEDDRTRHVRSGKRTLRYSRLAGFSQVRFSNNRFLQSSNRSLSVPFHVINNSIWINELNEVHFPDDITRLSRSISSISRTKTNAD